jgi:hypothetical protein
MKYASSTRVSTPRPKTKLNSPIRLARRRGLVLKAVSQVSVVPASCPNVYVDAPAARTSCCTWTTA